MHQTSILFICTGNVYRSRFAEALLNYFASEAGLPLRARSRGLAPHRALEDSISPYAEGTLRSLGIPLHHTALTKQPLVEGDLKSADQVIAMSRDEHRPMIISKFRRYLGRVEFWNIEGVHLWEPERALNSIEIMVRKLVGEHAAPLPLADPVT